MRPRRADALGYTPKDNLSFRKEKCMGISSSLIVFFIIVFIAATTGGYFSPGPWYETLNKPSWTPPNWLFPIAWTVLYTMIAIAGWKVWQNGGLSVALVIWFLGLLMALAWPISSSSAYLFIPYLFWVSFAGLLNFVVWRLNS